MELKTALKPGLRRKPEDRKLKSIALATLAVVMAVAMNPALFSFTAFAAEEMESTLEKKTDSKAEEQVDVKAEQKTDSKAEQQSDSKVEQKSESKAEQRTEATAQPQQDGQSKLPSNFYVTPDYNKSTIDEVDKIITKELYSAKLSKTAWPQALKEQRSDITNSKNLAELSKNVGIAIGALKSSHCQFATPNDEAFFFLHALFGSFNKKLGRGKADFTGFVTGTLGFADNQVRYVLDDSPAEKAGIRIGDKIESVNGNPYVGYSNFAGTSGAIQKLVIDREGKQINVNLKPDKVDFYDAYINAMKKSARIINSNRRKIGYVHVWCGGSQSHDALDEVMEEKLADTDGLIFDLRDGYGGNGLEDLDRFYRTEHAYPIFKTIYRDGKAVSYKYYYDKPVVAIINNGSRSGKELLAFSLKRTGRAKLVGSTTAGAVLGGRLFPINDRASLYLAIFDGTIGGVRIEGTGVSPDVEVVNTEHSQAGADKQLDVAIQELEKAVPVPPPISPKKREKKEK